MDFKYLIAVFALISMNDAVKVNMQGSLSFGKEVMDTITHYMRSNTIVSGRRSMLTPFSRDNDVLYLIIKSTYLCRDLQFCDGKLENFVNEYITVLTKSIEAIFETILNQRDKIDEESKIFKRLIFEEELKKCLRTIRKLLRNANEQVTEDNRSYQWHEFIKKLSIMFQTAALVFATDRLESNPSDINDVKKKLLQKFVIATIIIEGKYISKLCIDYNICIKSYEVTKALNTLFGAFEEMDEDKVKIFLRFVSEALVADSNFYSLLSDVTANEMQIILNDMAYTDNVATKEVLMSIYRTIADRLSSITTKKYVATNGKDVELLHVILSDMDHAYGNRKFDPFHSFISSFFEWIRSGTKLSASIRALLKDLEEQVKKLPDDLNMKLMNEVKSFLEITVDPEK